MALNSSFAVGAFSRCPLLSWSLLSFLRPCLSSSSWSSSLRSFAVLRRCRRRCAAAAVVASRRCRRRRRPRLPRSSWSSSLRSFAVRRRCRRRCAAAAVVVALRCRRRRRPCRPLSFSNFVKSKHDFSVVSDAPFRRVEQGFFTTFFQQFFSFFRPARPFTLAAVARWNLQPEALSASFDLAASRSRPWQ